MKRLLIVDDNEDHRLILRTMLEGRGYVCEEAEDGTMALDRLGAKQMDLVLTDFNMPRTDGLQLIGHMAERAQFQKIPVILMTSQEIGDVSRSPCKDRWYAILPKPYDCQEILAVVSCALNLSR